MYNCDKHIFAEHAAQGMCQNSSISKIHVPSVLIFHFHVIASPPPPNTYTTVTRTNEVYWPKSPRPSAKELNTICINISSLILSSGRGEVERKNKWYQVTQRASCFKGLEL